MGTECPCSHVHISMPSCGRGRGYIDAVQGLVIGRGRERERESRGTGWNANSAQSERSYLGRGKVGVSLPEQWRARVGITKCRLLWCVECVHSGLSIEGGRIRRAAAVNGAKNEWSRLNIPTMKTFVHPEPRKNKSSWGQLEGRIC